MKLVGDIQGKHVVTKLYELIMMIFLLIVCSHYITGIQIFSKFISIEAKKVDKVSVHYPTT